MLSVIVPAYNVAPYLRQCLDSVCCQTYGNLEILCVDDGSTDGTLDILREYEARDSRVRVFAQPNAGVTVARNTALAAATGEWLVGLDPDDWLELHAYETAMQGAREDVDLVCFGARVVPDAGMEGHVRGVQNYMTVPFVGFRKLTDGLLPRLNYNVWNKLYRRSVIEENALRFDEGLRCGSDMCFNAYFNAHARAAFFIDAPLYCYRLRSGSITFAPKSEENRCETHLVCMEKMLGYYRKHGLEERFPSYLWHLVMHAFEEQIRRGGRVGTMRKWMGEYAERLEACLRDGYPSLERMLEGLLARLRRLRQSDPPALAREALFVQRAGCWLASHLTWGGARLRCRRRERECRDFLRLLSRLSREGKLACRPAPSEEKADPA